MKREKRKEAMRNPIDALPEKELCEYEKIREDIIKERNEAMANYNFFEELIETKKEIGLCKKNLKPEKQTKKSKEKGNGKKQPDKLDEKIEEVGKEPQDKSKISENKEKSKIVIKDPENIMKNELNKAFHHSEHVLMWKISKYFIFIVNPYVSIIQTLLTGHVRHAPLWSTF